MAHYEDLDQCNYFGAIDGRLLAVGWLAREHAYTRGRVAPEFFESLVSLIANAWQPFATAGRHPCPFCVFTGGPSEIRLRDANVLLGATNVFVPAEEGVYVAPSLVLHYMDAHEYVPPQAFQRAVAACPPMRSLDYLQAIKRHRVNRLGNPLAR